MRAGEHNVERQPDRREPTAHGGRSNPGGVTLVGLQRAAGNGAVAQLLAVLSRSTPSASVIPESAVAVQRDPTEATPAADPNGLAGTPFSAFHPSLKTALTTKFDKGTFPTLAAALNSLSNEKIAILARIGSRIGDYDPGVWTYITKIRADLGWWITDNWGGWFELDTSGMMTYLSGSKKWCKDNETTAQKLHGTKDAYREIAGQHPGLHVPIKATSDVHVDYHQPADGRADDGSCTWSKIGWLGHAVDYVGGGGASETGVALYAQLRDKLSRAKPTDRVPAESIAKAKELLDSVAGKVQQYAAQGGLEGGEFKGDTAMKNDAATMDALRKADSLLDPSILDPSVDPMPFMFGP